MNSYNQETPGNTSKKSASIRKIPISRLSKRNEKLMELGEKIARIDEKIEAIKAKISTLREDSKTSEFVIMAEEERINLQLMEKAMLVSQFEDVKKIFTDGVSRNTKLN